MKPEFVKKLDQVHAEIESRLSSGEWKVGDRIPTEAQLSAEFGCSVGTVSKAIARLTASHVGVLERRTRGGTRVMRDIREALETPPSLDLDACAMIFSGEPHEGIWSVVRGFQDAAQSAGRRTVMLTSGKNVRQEAEIIGRLTEFDVKGAVVYPIIPNPADQVLFSQIVLNCSFPIIFADINLPGTGRPAVVIDGFHAGYTMTKHLLDKGVRNVGFLANYAWVNSTRDRYLGYRHAMEEAGIDIHKEWVCLDPNMHPNFSDPMQEPKWIAHEYLEGKDDLQAVVCANDFLALGCLAVAQELGINVPEELKVVGIDNFSMASSSHPPLTTYASPHEEVGRQAFRLLNKMISGTQPDALEYQVRGDIVIRSSS